MLLKLARSPLGRYCVGWIMENISSLLPVKRLYETDRLLAFMHPQPIYLTHILIVPKRAVPDLAALSAEGDSFAIHFMADLLGCVNLLVGEFNLESAGYRLIVNGGKYQDIPELHFHLVSGPLKE